jgi:acetyl-CoA C-acetyltransferase
MITIESITRQGKVSRARLAPMAPVLLITDDGGVRTLTLNRPAAYNSLTTELKTDLLAALRAAAADASVRAVVLTGAGKAFCAGQDLKEHVALLAAGDPAPLRTVDEHYNPITLAIARMPKPVIAAVNGVAEGAGCEIALACHLVVADAAAWFRLGEVRAGQVAGAGGLVRLPRAIPEKIATELIVTGRRMDAAEAHRWGLVNRVTEAGAALATARELAAEILAGSPSAVRSALQIMADTRGTGDTVTAVHRTGDALEDLMLTDDAAEGMKALAEQRAPRWRNR